MHFLLLLIAANRRTYPPCTSICPVGPEVRIQIPQHPLALLTALDSRGPFPAKTNFVHPVPAGESGAQQGKRRQRQRPRFVPEKRSDDAENARGEFPTAPARAVDSSATAPH